MSDVKWIKISSGIFDDDAFQLIDSMPEADAIELIWFKLLVFAGASNNQGVFLFKDKIAYTDEMLAAVFHRPLNTVRLALQTFEKFGMIEKIDNVYSIPNWCKYQSLDAYERKKERDRIYQQQRREQQKNLIEDKKSSDNRLTVGRDCSYSYSLSNSNKENKYIYNKHSNTENLIYILDNNKDYEKIRPELRQAMVDWMEYKDEVKPKSKNHYVEKGLKSWITTTINYASRFGISPVIAQINKAITNQWVGTNYDMLEKEPIKNQQTPTRPKLSPEELRKVALGE